MTTGLFQNNEGICQKMNTIDQNEIYIEIQKKFLFYVATCGMCV